MYLENHFFQVIQKDLHNLFTCTIFLLNMIQERPAIDNDYTLTSEICPTVQHVINVY